GSGAKWFPDNNSVLVVLDDLQGSGVGIYRLTLDTGNTQLLVHSPRYLDAYDLSPDGQSIFYSFASQDGRTLNRFDIESRSETVLKKKEVNYTVSLAVSPDSTQVAATHIGGVVDVIPAAGGEVREVFHPAASVLVTGALANALTWTPDQRFLLFVQR